MVLVIGDGKQCGSETDGQIVRVHEILIAVLRHVVEERKQVTHDDDASR